MSFSKAEVEKIARLARLELTPDETDRMSRELGAILDYIEELKELDTDNVEPLAHCLPVQNVFRDDVPTGSLSVEEALKNAPKRTGDFFAVPAILE